MELKANILSKSNLKFISLNHETTKDRTKIDSNDGSDGDTISGHLPQAWNKPRVVPIPMYSSVLFR